MKENECFVCARTKPFRGGFYRQKKKITGTKYWIRDEGKRPTKQIVRQFFHCRTCKSKRKTLERIQSQFVCGNFDNTLAVHKQLPLSFSLSLSLSLSFLVGLSNNRHRETKKKFNSTYPFCFYHLYCSNVLPPNSRHVGPQIPHTAFLVYQT